MPGETVKFLRDNSSPCSYNATFCCHYDKILD